MFLYHKGKKYICTPIGTMARDKIAATISLLDAFEKLQASPIEMDGVFFSFLSGSPKIHASVNAESWDYVRSTITYPLQKAGIVKLKHPSAHNLLKEVYRVWELLEWEYVYETSYAKIIAQNLNLPYNCDEDAKVLLIPKIFNDRMLSTVVDENA